MRKIAFERVLESHGRSLNLIQKVLRDAGAEHLLDSDTALTAAAAPPRVPESLQRALLGSGVCHDLGLPPRVGMESLWWKSLGQLTALALSQTAGVFVLSPDLTAALGGTECNARPADIRLPLRSTYVKTPGIALRLRWAHSGGHPGLPVEGFLAHMARDYLRLEWVCADQRMVRWFPSGIATTFAGDIEAAIEITARQRAAEAELSARGLSEKRERRGAIHPAPQLFSALDNLQWVDGGSSSGEDLFGSTAFRVAINALLYLSSRSADFVAIPARAPHPLARRERRERKTRLAHTLVGSRLKLDFIRKVREAERRTGETAHKLTRRFVVRGHWRNQAHGAGRLERRLIWIEPHWKGPEMAELVKREYVVDRDPSEAPERLARSRQAHEEETRRREAPDA